MNSLIKHKTKTYLTKKQTYELINRLVQNLISTPFDPFYFFDIDLTELKRIKPDKYKNKQYDMHVNDAIQFFTVHPLHFACYDCQEMIEPLLKAGNDSNVIMECQLIMDVPYDVGGIVDGDTELSPLIILVLSKCKNLMKYLKLLLKYGADINSKNTTNRMNILHYYFTKYNTGNIDIEFLLKNGVKLNEQIYDRKQTALHLAVLYDKKVIPLLLSYGADPFIKDKNDKYPIDYLEKDSQEYHLFIPYMLKYPEINNKIISEYRILLEVMSDASSKLILNQLYNINPYNGIYKNNKLLSIGEISDGIKEDNYSDSDYDSDSELIQDEHYIYLKNGDILHGMCNGVEKSLMKDCNDHIYNEETGYAYIFNNKVRFTKY